MGIVLIGGALLGLATGSIVTFIKLPAIITLATSFIWAGWALFVLSVPGGHLPVSFAQDFTGRIVGTIPTPLAALAAVLLIWKLIKMTRSASASTRSETTRAERSSAACRFAAPELPPTLSRAS